MVVVGIITRDNKCLKLLSIKHKWASYFVYVVYICLCCHVFTVFITWISSGEKDGMYNLSLMLDNENSKTINSEKWQKIEFFHTISFHNYQNWILDSNNTEYFTTSRKNKNNQETYMVIKFQHCNKVIPFG